jgi:hypothetical protein
MYRQILAQQTKENQKRIWREVNEMRECGRETLWQEGFDADDTNSVLHYVLRSLGLVDQYKMAEVLW